MGGLFDEALIDLFNRVDVTAQLDDGEHLEIVLEGAVIGLIHLEGREVHDLLVFFETHADELGAAGDVAFAFFLVAPTAFEGKDQVLFVGGDDHLAAIGNDHIILLAGVVLFVDNDVTDHGVIGFLFTDLYHIALDPVEEDAFLDIEGGFGIDDVVLEGLHLQVGDGIDVVVEEEGQEGDHDGDDEEGAQEAEQGDAGRFDRYEFVGFAEVAQGHDAAEQDGQGQGQGDDGGGDVHEHPEDGEGVESFAHHIVNVQPHELEHQYEGGDKERSDKRP